MLDSAVADALDVDLLGFAQLATVLALGDGAAFLLYFEKGTVKVFARGRAVALYAGFTGNEHMSSRASERTPRRIPSVFFITDNLGDVVSQWGGKPRRCDVP